MLKLKSSPTANMFWWFVRGLILLLLLTFVARFIYDYRQISNYQTNTWSTDLKADCAVVLTGGAGRIQEGIHLLSKGNIKRLIISGVSPQVKLNEIVSPISLYHPQLEELILLEKRSTTTYGNAQQTLPIVEAMGCQDLVLVTSKSHMYRALQVFRSIYPAEIAIISHAISSGKNENWSDLSTEVLKSIFYSLWVY